jgi:hypothetical protein
MTAFKLVVCERTGHWAGALRKELPLFTEVRSLTACGQLLESAPLSLVALEVTEANLGQSRDFVLMVGERFPQAAVVALLTTEVLDAERLFREAGTVDVIGSVLDMPRLARLARRMSARTSDVEMSLGELIDQTLPWPAQATAQWAGNEGVGSRQ